ncbi:MAG: hypothetical protein HY329_04940 [Chloroflexi bacterium]|nr:hypothetical protein [Chloroflexota bacterium]
MADGDGRGTHPRDRFGSVAAARSITVQVPGTCGELIQGSRQGIPFLVSCPIDAYSTVTVTLLADTQSSADGASSPVPSAITSRRAAQPPLGPQHPRPDSQHAAPGSCVVLGPVDCQKATLALEKVLRSLGAVGLRIELRVSSPLPRSKGFGSSTADIAGAIAAGGALVGQPLEPIEIARLAVSIEPTDSSMLPGLAAFDHLQGSFHEKLGQPPPIFLAVLDFPGVVDTLEFNAVDHVAARAAGEPELAEALALLRRGVRDGRVDLIGRATTLSAVANQRVLFKPELDAVRELGRELGALGVNVGHSGTIVGLLFDHPDAATRAIARARAQFPSLESARAQALVGGGVRLHRGRSSLV